MNNYVKNTSWILIEKVSRIISGLLVGIMVARYLGPDKLGVISYAVNVVAIFAIVSTLGLDGLIVRELILRREDKNTILGTSFWMKLTGSLLVVIASTFYSYLRDTEEQTIIVFLISISIVLQSFVVIDCYFQSAVKGKLTAINQVITLVISAIVKLFLIFFKAPVACFAVIVSFEAALTALNQILFFRKDGMHIGMWRFSIKECKSLLIQAWPIIFSGLILLVYQKMDQILIKRLLNVNMVGQYAAAIRVSEAANFIPVAICAAVFPGILNAKADRAFQEKRLIQLYSLMIYSALFIAIGGTIFGEDVMRFMYKDKFNLSPEIFRIHIWSTIPIFWGAAWGMWVLSQNRQVVSLIIQVISLAICLTLNMYLIPKLGAKGAAWAILLTYYIGFFNTNLLYRPKESFSFIFRALNPRNIVELTKYIFENTRK